MSSGQPGNQRPQMGPKSNGAAINQPPNDPPQEQETTDWQTDTQWSWSQAPPTGPLHYTSDSLVLTATNPLMRVKIKIALKICREGGKDKK